MNEPDYTSVDPQVVDPFEGYDLCLCGHCNNFQYELPHPLDKGGKYGWQCDSCGTRNEGDKVHLLQNTAYFRPKRGFSYW